MGDTRKRSGDLLLITAYFHPVTAALPLIEPVVQSGPFVMDTNEEIEQAFFMTAC